MDLQSMLFEQARELEREGNLAQAAEFYRRILADQPGQIETITALGRLLCRQQAWGEVLPLYSQATSRYPDNPGLWLDFGLVLLQAGHVDLGKRALLSAASLWPDDPALLSNLADALREQRLFEDAMRQYQRLAGLMPDLAAAHNNLGICLLEMGRRSEAFEPFQRAVEANPDMPEALSNLAMLSVERGLNSQAIKLYGKFRTLRPDLVQGPLNQGVAYYRESRLEEAAAALRDALALEPDNAQVHYNLAQVLLLKGDLTNGFAEYEWRWASSEFPSPRLMFLQPRWQGEPLAGRTLLVHAEQGFGDVLQFCRLLPLAARGGKVVFLGPGSLMELMEGLEGVTLVAEGNELPKFDLYCPLLSLPHLLGPGFEVRPPYLKAPQQTMFDKGPGLHVGLVWAGNPLNGRNHVRSVPLEALAGLPDLPGLQYHSLQYQPTGGWQQQLPFSVHDISSNIKNFQDLAAAMDQLDLIISMCSAPVHLAGALGRPCWVMLHQLPDWRWGMEGSECPWYPDTMRLYRQSIPGDWSSVIHRISTDLIYLKKGATL